MAKKKAAKNRWPLGRRVEIEWIDSALDSGWAHIDNKRRCQDIATCRSLGYLLDANTERVRLVSSQSVDDAVCDGMSIPRVAVRTIRTVR